MVLVLLSWLGQSLVISPASAAAAGDTLIAGSQLTAHGAHHLLRSSSGQFTLEITSDGLFLEQQARFVSGGATGGPTWTLQPRSGRVVALRMRTDGNLVLYDDARHALWSSGTGGTGSRNRMVVLNNGDVAIYTRAGRRVWALGSRPGYLTAGHGLAPGASLFRQVRPPNLPLMATRLTMQRNGDLVLTYGAHVTWHTNTHVPGSYLSLQSTGTLVLYSPAHRVLWSHIVRAGAQTWLAVDSCGVARLWSQRTLMPYWSTPYVRFPYC